MVDFDSGGDGNTETTITNELTMGGGSVVVNPPIYGAASTLHLQCNVWLQLERNGLLVPPRGKVCLIMYLSVQGGPSRLLDTTGNFTCTGDFTMDDASGSLDLVIDVREI